MAFLYVAAMTLLTLALAMLSYRFIETPFLRLKGRFVADQPVEGKAASFGLSQTVSSE
jgi:peptidoglycan/LPS O-acetylase OafA/YrhL